MNVLDKIEEKIVDWVLAALFDWVLAALGCLLGYPILYKSNVDSLKTQVEELRGARDRLQHNVDTARRNRMKIEDDVKRRLTESDDIIAVAEKILEDDKKGWYLNMMSRYQVSKGADKAALEAKNLKDEILKIDRNSVGYHEPPQVIETATSNRGYEAFESRKPTITGVLEALKDPNIARIGIHGMGGVGKTMLVKEVQKQAEKDKLFDKYLFLVVSNDPDLKRIQREMAEKLDLKLEVESELVRGDQLHKRLKKENRVLIILDDIWKKLDLETLGIFFGDNQKGCKLLLTSRLQNILRVDTQIQFPVGVLSDNEAISLFGKIVGDLAKTGEFKSNMPQIVKECAGLPIAIATVANVLKNKDNIFIWKDALNKLKMSCPIKIEGMEEEVYKSIKLSYEFLENDEAKSLLPLFSLHREDYNIKVEDLLKYGVGLDLFQNVDTIEEARWRVHSLLDILKDSSFLLDGKGTVKMHDVIRDVVINIVAEERHMFTVRTVKELQTQSKCKDTVAISLPYIIDDLKFPNQFECSKLELLLLFDQKFDFRIPDSFFEGLKYLKVLKLSRSWSGVLPSSLSSLKNLQTLYLSGEVQNVITIGELKNLKALSLSLSEIEQLPKEIGQLTHLQLLDMEECFKLKFIIKSTGVLGSIFPILESINLSNMINLERICNTPLPAEFFRNLRVVKVRKCCNLEFFFSSSMVECFSHLQEMEIDDCEKMSEIIAIERKEEIEVNTDENIMFTKLRSLKLRKLLKLKGFFSDDESLVLFNKKVIFPDLEQLEIEGMYNMKMIWPDQIISDFFVKLETMTVYDCTNLMSIVPHNMLRTLQNLKRLKIANCCSIEEVFEIQGTNNVEETHDIAATELESLELRNLAKLKHVWSLDPQGIITFGKLNTVKIHNCSNLNGIFPTSVAKALMHLEKLVIYDCAKVEEIVAKEEGIKTATSFEFPRLMSLILEYLPELKRFYPGKHTLKCPLLKLLVIFKCDKLKNFGSNKLRVEETNGLGHDVSVIQQPLFFIEKGKFPNLEVLILDDAMNETCGGSSAEFCCNLKELILYGNSEIPNVEAPRAGVSDFRRLMNIVPFSSTSFYYLKELQVYSSNVLISLLTPQTARTLVQLQLIRIRNCERMTELVANEGSEAEAEAGDEIVFNNLTSLEFDNLPSLTAFHLGNRTTKFPSLDDVRVSNCPKLKIFSSRVLSTPNLTCIWIEGNEIIKEERDGDLNLNATIKEYWEAKLETCDQKFAQMIDASEGGESEHDTNDDLESDTTSEVEDTQRDGE